MFNQLQSGINLGDVNDTSTTMNSRIEYEMESGKIQNSTNVENRNLTSSSNDTEVDYEPAPPRVFSRSILNAPERCPDGQKRDKNGVCRRKS